MNLPTISTPHFSANGTTQTLLAAGSVVLAGLALGTLITYRRKVAELLRKPFSSEQPATSPQAYEQWTKEELYERAREKDIEGRSTMTKEELIEALREA